MESNKQMIDPLQPSSQPETDPVIAIDAEEQFSDTLCQITPVVSRIQDFPWFIQGVLSAHSDPLEQFMALISVSSTLGAVLYDVSINYGGRKHYPLLYSAVITPPSGGKSTMSFAKLLLDPINDELKKTYQQQMDRYRISIAQYKTALKNGGTAIAPKVPAFKQISLSGNVTTARLIQQLEENGELALLIHEGEADVVAKMFGSEHGSTYSTLLRLAHHHESFGSARKQEKETITVKVPKIAMVLAGTPSQLNTLFSGNEDGLFSRFLIFNLEPKIEWRSPRPCLTCIPIDEHYRDWGNKLLVLWQELPGKSFEAKLSQKQWDRLDEIGKQFQAKAHLIGDHFAISIARRHLLMAVRLASIFSFFRRLDPQTCATSNIPAEYYCTDLDVDLAVEIIKISFEHALHLFQTMGKTKPHFVQNSVKKEQLLVAMPEEFTMEELNQAAEKYQVPSRTKSRWIKEFCETGILEKIARAKYRKTPVALMALAQKDNLN